MSKVANTFAQTTTPVTVSAPNAVLVVQRYPLTPDAKAGLTVAPQNALFKSRHPAQA